MASRNTKNKEAIFFYLHNLGIISIVLLVISIGFNPLGILLKLAMVLLSFFSISVGIYGGFILNYFPKRGFDGYTIKGLFAKITGALLTVFGISILYLILR